MIFKKFLPLKFAIGILLLFSVILSPGVLKLKTDLSNKSMNADNLIWDTKEESGPLIIISLLSQTNLQEQIKTTKKLETFIAQKKGVLKTLSPVSAKYPLYKNNSVEETGLIENIDLVELKNRLEKVPGYQNSIIVKEVPRWNILVLLDKNWDAKGVDVNWAKELQDHLKSSYLNSYQPVLSGLPLFKIEVARLVDKDQTIIIPLTVVALCFLIFLTFRKIQITLILILQMGVSLLWTFGCLGWCGIELNPLTSLIPPAVMITSLAPTFHLIWDSAILKINDSSNQKPIFTAWNYLFKPCLMTSLTTIAGFLSLMINPIPAVRYFGIFASLGCLFSFFISMILMPPIIEKIELPEKILMWSNLIAKISYFSARKRGLVFTISALLLVIGIYGTMKIKSDTNLTLFLSDKSQIRNDSKIIDEFIGSQSLEVLITQKNDSLHFSYDDFSTIKKINLFLKNDSSVKKIFSPLDLIDVMSGRLANPHFPDEFENIITERTLLQLDKLNDNFGYIRKSGRQWVLTCHLKNLGTGELIEKTDYWKKQLELLLPNHLKLSFGGEFYRMSYESQNLVSSQIKSLLLAILLIGIFFALIFKSFRILSISFFPNIIPLLLTFGFMGFANINLDTGTIMIICVCAGLVVDDTIHFTSHFLGEQNDNNNIEAIYRTAGKTGMILSATTAILVIGFSVACLGSFAPTRMFSFLTAATLLCALLFDLTLLPAGLSLMPNRKIK